MSEQDPELNKDLKTLPAKTGEIDMSPPPGWGERQNVEELYRAAQLLFQSGLVPKAFQNDKEVMYALGMGQDLGFTNTQSLACITIINGKPSVYADGLPAILLRSGHFFMEDFSGTIEDETYTATIQIVRSDSGSEVIRSFSVKDAIRADLWQTEPMIMKDGRNGPYETKNDSPWWKYPKRMIWRRAIGWAVRDALADQMYGLQIAEEQADHAETIRKSREPRGSKLGDKIKALKGPNDDEGDIIIEIDLEPEEVDVDERPANCRDRIWDETGAGPKSGCDVEGCKGVFGRICIPEEEQVPAEEASPSSADAASDETEGDPTLPTSSEASEEEIDLPRLAVDWFDYLRSSDFDISTFEKDLASEQAEKWFLELDEKTKEFIQIESARIVATEKAASKPTPKTKPKKKGS